MKNRKYNPGIRETWTLPHSNLMYPLTPPLFLFIQGFSLMEITVYWRQLQTLSLLIYSCGPLERDYNDLENQLWRELQSRENWGMCFYFYANNLWTVSRAWLLHLMGKLMVLRKLEHYMGNFEKAGWKSYTILQYICSFELRHKKN